MTEETKLKLDLAYCKRQLDTVTTEHRVMSTRVQRVEAELMRTQHRAVEAGRARDAAWRELDEIKAALQSEACALVTYSETTVGKIRQLADAYTELVAEHGKVKADLRYLVEQGEQAETTDRRDEEWLEAAPPMDEGDK